MHLPKRNHTLPSSLIYKRSNSQKHHPRSLLLTHKTTMYSSAANNYPKDSCPPPPSSNQPLERTSATGIPVSSADSYPSSAPKPLHIQSQPRVPWSTGLCDCGDDVGSCCLTYWCPCITFGRIIEIVDRGSTSCGTGCALYTLIMLVTGWPCLYSCFYRTKLRDQYLLPKDPCGDCLVHCCCESCALCQEYRELKNQGFDMKIGPSVSMMACEREKENPRNYNLTSICDWRHESCLN